MGAGVIRRAEAADAAEVARLLHDFNTEFSDPTPGVEVLTGRLGQLLEDGQVTVLLGGDEPDGLALFRLRPSLWDNAPEAYLEELYVTPPQRGKGLGRALLEAAMQAVREAGAIRMDLCTGETDTAARALYESCGFTNREGGPGDPIMLYYERDL
ncbi:MAG TPA: GNAT family N-acetyltransferase [Solirubrobacterales bacterium]|jgi:GNAT superfamily N-acetyltransferase|nr:GNAT family N-acetyltransferase [Solirubrobacterales bacterium]